jgi:hypothetical protein
MSNQIKVPTHQEIKNLIESKKIELQKKIEYDTNTLIDIIKGMLSDIPYDKPYVNITASDIKERTSFAFYKESYQDAIQAYKDAGWKVEELPQNEFLLPAYKIYLPE